MHTKKPRLSFWQLWNMSFGFLGIQFGWGLQMANMSAIYEFLGAEPHSIPMLWLAAPLTGLVVQPIIGYMSDRTWGPLGRRRPYFLVGAILSSFALIAMPNSSSLWMAAGLLWILDASINVSMEPFRAFVTDVLPEDQRTEGFAMQGFFIGLGAVVASALPWMMTNLFHVEAGHGGGVPFTVKLSFYIGAVAFLAAVTWTVVTSKEYPPDDLEQFRIRVDSERGVGHGVREILGSIREMPATMRQLAWVQIFTWLGLFCMWLYFTPAITRSVFLAPDEKSPLYLRGVEWGGLCFGMYSAVCFLFSFALPAVARKLGRRATHGICLLVGSLALLSVCVISNKYLLLVSMAGVGIAWASILSIPYAILAGSLPPDRTGTFLGIFNFFIVIPEILAALVLGQIMHHILGNDRLLAVMAGGASLGIAALLMVRVQDPEG